MSNSYHYKKGQMELGPYPLERMQGLARQGQIGRTHQISTDGGATWLAGASFPEIFKAPPQEEKRSRVTASSGSPLEDDWPTPGSGTVAVAGDWLVAQGGQQLGPFSFVQLQQAMADQRIFPYDLFWKPGMQEWVHGDAVPGLFTAAVVPGGTSSFENQPRSQRSGLEYADFLPRVGAAIIDGIILSFMTCIPAGICAFGFGVLAAAGAQDAGNADAAGAVVGASYQICSAILGAIIGAIYYVALETSPKQGTFGKQMVGIKVTDLDGRRITTGRALGRFFARYLTACTCGIGWLLPLFTEKRQTLHDMMSGCLAVNK